MKCIFCHIQKIWIFIVGNTNFTTSKIIKIFDSIRSLKIKALSSSMLKKKYRVVIDDPNKNIVCNLNWKRYLFDFDACYRDLNFCFSFKHKNILNKWHFFQSWNHCKRRFLRHGKNFGINAFFTDWLLSKKKENGVVIGNYEEYQKLTTNKKYLMLLIQTNNGLCIHWGTIFFTCLKEFKNGTFINKHQHFIIITIPPNYLAQLRRKFKNISLTNGWFDEWRCYRDVTATRHKNDIQHNKYYQ